MGNKYFFAPLFFLFAVSSLWSTEPSKLSDERSQKFIVRNIQTVIPNRITSIASFNEICSELDSADGDTLVIFDVDEVLITYNDMVLRPCGAHFRPVSWKDVDPEEIPYLISIMLDEGKVILVDPSIPRLIDKLERRGVKTMALTAARTGKFGVMEKAEDWRLTILKQFNLDFSKSFPKNQTIYFCEETNKESNYSIFKNGILFLGDEKNTKGALLAQFLDKIQWKPKKVLFIDDKMPHLTSVATALDASKIPFQGYHYQGAEQLPSELNEQIAEAQFAYLRKHHKWLSDSEAKKAGKYLSIPHQ